MKKNLSLIISFIGIVSIAGGILLIKTLENPNDFILTLSYICIGVGCGIFGHGMGNFVTIKTIQNNPEIKKQMEIVRKDERNIAISNRAKAKAYDLMTYSICNQEDDSPKCYRPLLLFITEYPAAQQRHMKQ